jgi:hypothetical protein
MIPTTSANSLYSGFIFSFIFSLLNIGFGIYLFVSSLRLANATYIEPDEEAEYMQKKAQRKPVLAKPEPSKVFTIHPKQDDDDIEDIPIDNEKKQKKDPPKKVQRENASRAGKSRASENDGNNE